MSYNYQRGYCHYFADIIINEIRKLVPKNYPVNYYLILGYRYVEDEIDEYVLIHVYIKIGNYYLDSEGFHTVDEVNDREQQWIDIEEINKPENSSYETFQEQSEKIPKEFFYGVCDPNEVKRDIKKFMSQPQFKNFVKRLIRRL